MKTIFLAGIFLIHLIECLKNQVLKIGIKTCDIQYTQTHLELDGNIDLVSCQVTTCVKQQQSLSVLDSSISRQPLTKCYVNEYKTNYQCFSRCCDTSFRSIQQCIQYQRNKGLYRILEIIVLFIFFPCLCFTFSFFCILVTGILVSPLSTILLLRNKLRRTNIRDSQWVDVELSEIGRSPEKQNQCLICFQQKCDSILQCKHSYHLNCLKNWLKVQKSCPICRQKDKKTVNYFCPKCLAQKYQFKSFQQVEAISQIKDCPNCQYRSKNAQNQSNQTGYVKQINNSDHFI